MRQIYWNAMKQARKFVEIMLELEVVDGKAGFFLKEEIRYRKVKRFAAHKLLRTALR